MLRIYAHNPHSQGAKALAMALGCRRIAHNGSRFTGRRGGTVINWGSSSLPAWPYRERLEILNQPEAISQVANKLTFFELMAGQNVTPLYTRSKEIAKQWITEKKWTVVCRTVLSGHSGQGIVISKTPDSLVDAPLYVLYVPKKEEYRVHIFRGEVIDVQRKARRRDCPDEQVDWRVRNHHNGFIYAREGAEAGQGYQQVLDKSREVFAHTTLDFGAVDAIFNQHSNTAYVLEINTAPGLTGTTVNSYANKLREFV